MTKNFVAYRLVIDYSLIIGNNQWLINWLPIDYWWISLMSSISYVWCEAAPRCLLWAPNGVKKLQVCFESPLNLIGKWNNGFFHRPSGGPENTRVEHRLVTAAMHLPTSQGVPYLPSKIALACRLTLLQCEKGLRCLLGNTYLHSSMHHENLYWLGW